MWGRIGTSFILLSGVFANGCQPRLIRDPSLQAKVSPAASVAFAVSSTLDQADAAPGDGLCDSGAGVCTLRAALQEAGSLNLPVRLTLPSGTVTLSLGEIPITTDATIVGPDSGPPSVVSGNNLSRVFNVTSKSLSLESVTLDRGNAGAAPGGAVYYENPNGVVDLKRVTIQNSITTTSDLGGGGLYFKGKTFSISESLIKGNSLVTGGGSNLGAGGVYVDYVTDLSIATTRFEGNSSTVSGGALYIQSSQNMIIQDSSFLNNTAGPGGGGAIHDRTAFPTWTVRRCVFQNNSATNYAGGAMLLESAYQQKIENSTFFGNNAGGAFAFNGGAILFLFPWHLPPYPQISFSTLVGNSATGSGGGVFYNVGAGSGHVEISNSILSGNTGGSCGALGAGVYISTGYNIEDANTCGLAATGDLINTDPLVVPGPPADNGGKTATIALQPASPARDAANLSSCVGTDQRSSPRPGGGRCDIGAYEF